MLLCPCFAYFKCGSLYTDYALVDVCEELPDPSTGEAVDLELPFRFHHHRAHHERWSLIADKISVVLSSRDGSSIERRGVSLLSDIWSIVRMESVWPVWYVASVGMVAGISGGLFGGVTGLLVTGLLSTWPSARTHQSLAASNFALLPVTAISSALHIRAGTPVWPLVPWLFAGSLVGTFLGSHYLVHQTNEEQRQLLFAVVITLVAARSIFRP